MGTVSVAGRTAVVFCLGFLLPHFGFISCESSSLLQAVGTVSGNVTLSPLNTQPLQEIMWKKGRDKVAEWDPASGMSYYSSLVGRAHLYTKSGDLHIFNLTSSDEGEYEVELNHLSAMKFNLTIFDLLPSPKLLCDSTNESTEFQCVVQDSYSRHREQLNYSWSCSLPQCEKSKGPVLSLEKNSDLPQEIYCSVANPEANRTSSIVLSTICHSGGNSRHRYSLIATPVFVTCILLFIHFLKYPGNTKGTTSR